MNALTPYLEKGMIDGNLGRIMQHLQVPEGTRLRLVYVDKNSREPSNARNNGVLKQKNGSAFGFLPFDKKTNYGEDRKVIARNPGWLCAHKTVSSDSVMVLSVVSTLIALEPMQMPRGRNLSNDR